MKTSCVPLEDLFEIEHGNKFDYNKMEESESDDDAVVFVNRSGLNNGMVGLVRRIPTTSPYAAGSITVALGGSALASFVQPKDFYTAQNIDVLFPRSPMTDEVKLYYCLCIEANRYRYSTFGREANRTLRTLLLPRLTEVPQWVHGATFRAAEAVARDMNTFMDGERRRSNQSAGAAVAVSPSQSMRRVLRKGVP